MEDQKQNRYKYMVRTDRYKEQKFYLNKQFPNRNKFSFSQAQYYLKTQGILIKEQQIFKLSEKIFGKKDKLDVSEVIGIYARLNLDEQVEKELRKIFDYFSGGEEVISTNQLKLGLTRLGQNLKETYINSIFTDLDLNFNGFVTFQTFLQAMLHQ